MRIELPLPSWSEALLAHDDAHTLTLPAQHPLPVPLLGTLAPADAGTSRIQVRSASPVTLTLTM